MCSVLPGIARPAGAALPHGCAPPLRVGHTLPAAAPLPPSAVPARRVLCAFSRGNRRRRAPPPPPVLRFFLTFSGHIIYNTQADKLHTEAQFEQLWRSRVARSSAHDWKSCRGQKLLEGSNPSSSAKTQGARLGPLCFAIRGIRRRLLAKPRWGFATAVAFPQKSESLLLRHLVRPKKMSRRKP